MPDVQNKDTAGLGVLLSFSMFVWVKKQDMVTPYPGGSGTQCFSAAKWLLLSGADLPDGACVTNIDGGVTKFVLRSAPET